MIYDAALPLIRAAPKDRGTIQLLVRRPTKGEREILDTAELDPQRGLVGDRWADGLRRNPDTQLTMMNTRAIAAIDADPSRWALAGDQLYVDFDISVTNLPVGTRLALDAAIIEITEPEHTGCAKFTKRFGAAATEWVNTPVGHELRLRGVNARVVRGGTIRRGAALLVSSRPPARDS